MTVIAMSRTEIDRMSVLQDLAANRIKVTEAATLIHAQHFTSSIGRLSRELQMESYPKFHNEVGVPIVRIGCREFKCIGDTG